MADSKLDTTTVLLIGAIGLGALYLMTRPKTPVRPTTGTAPNLGALGGIGDIFKGIGGLFQSAGSSGSSGGYLNAGASSDYSLLPLPSSSSTPSGSITV